MLNKLSILSVILLVVPSIALQLPPLAAQSNLFLRDDINCSLIEIRGRATVGRNVDINTVQIGCQVYSPDSNCQGFGSVTCSANPSAAPILRVGGNLNAVSSQVFGGSVVYGGNLTSGPQVVSDCSISRQAPGNTYQSESSSLVAFQTELTNTYASRASSGTNNGGNLVFSGTGQAVESFFIGYQTPSSLYAITLQNVNPSSTVVIFVGGASFNFANIGFQGQFQSLANKIIWSFAAVSINIRETSWFGTILAPNGFLYSTSAELNGQVFATSYYPAFGTQCSRVTLFPFTGTFPSSTQSSQQTSQTSQQSSAQPTSAQPTSASPTSAQPTSAQPTSAQPTSAQPTSAAPTSVQATRTSSVSPSSAPATSTGGIQACNGQPIYQPDLYSCPTNEQGQQVLCPKNNEACGRACYSPSQYCCRNGGLRQASQC